MPLSAEELYNQELATSVIITEDTVLRAKITDACGLACTFCHNEGTPVASSGQAVAFPTRGNRVSIYADGNGADFMPGTMQPDDSFVEALEVCRGLLNIDEVHFTGGEPTLHPRVDDLVSTTKENGYKVKITSNGETGSRRMESLALAGLGKINFSIFGTTPEELAQTQHEHFRNPVLAQRKIDALKEAVEACHQFGIKVDMNLVVAGSQDFDRAERLIMAYGDQASVRLLNDLSVPGAEEAIYSFLGGIGALPERRFMTAGASGSRTSFSIPGTKDGVQVKKIRQTRLPGTCDDCQFDSECSEGFYGVRLYTDNIGRYLVGVCIRRMDLTLGLEDFANSNTSTEVLEFREHDKQMLKDRYKSYIRGQ